MNSRWTNAAATASSSGIPPAVSPRIIPASTTPIPPGTGDTPPSMGAEHRAISAGKETASGARRRRAVRPRGPWPRAPAPTTSPPKISTRLRGWGVEHLQVVQDLGRLRTELGGGEASPPWDGEDEPEQEPDHGHGDDGRSNHESGGARSGTAPGAVGTTDPKWNWRKGSRDHDHEESRPSRSSWPWGTPAHRS